jgi:Flp pilus assembly protein TadD
MRRFSTPRLYLLSAVALLLTACAVRQDNGSAELFDPGNSARQELVADIQLDAGRVQLAVEGYGKALAARPKDAGLLVKQGLALLRLNQPESALESFRQAQTASPDLPGVHYGVGRACRQLGKNAEARDAFERAVELAPTSWRARSHLGVLLVSLGQPDQAREQFLAALALPQFQAQAGTEARDRRGELLNNLGVAQVLSGDTKAAVATFVQAMQSSRDPERSANNLGLLLVRLGRQAEALNAFRAGGNDARALNNLGYALLLQGQAGRAKSLFEKALDLSPAYYETAGENLKQALQGAPPAANGANDAKEAKEATGGAGAT